jgi:hypothetical protein
MTQRAIYEAIASDVTDGNDNAIADLTVFSNYAVRDALMVAGCEDEKFTQTLSIKVAKTVSLDVNADKPITEAHINALATAYHLNAMWEYTPVAKDIRETLDRVSALFSLEMPTLVRLTDRMTLAGWDMTSTRAQMVIDLKTAILDSLDEEVEN